MSLNNSLAPVFEGFDQKQVHRLYQIIDVKRYEPGQIIFEESETAESLFILLHGSVVTTTSLAGKTREISSFERGAWLGASEFNWQAPYRCTAVTRQPSKVMVLNQRKVDFFDEKMKLGFYRELAKKTARECNDLAVMNRKLSFSSHLAKKGLYEARIHKLDEYSRSPLVRSMVKKIPRLPLFVHTLTSRLLDENTTAGQIADIIQQDPSLTADVLRKVNSSYYGLRSKVSDISNAVLFLGFEALYQLAVSEGLRQAMPETPKFEEIHARALVISQMLFSMSRAREKTIPVRMATIGLLHNLGESVGELFIKNNPNLEIMISIIDQSQLGALLLEEWELPEAICRSVQYQDYPEFAPPASVPGDVVDSVALLHFAKLCYQLLAGTPEAKLPTLYAEAYKARLGWEGLSIEEILKKYVLDDLMKKINTLPEFIKKLIQVYTSN